MHEQRHNIVSFSSSGSRRAASEIISNARNGVKRALFSLERLEGQSEHNVLGKARVVADIEQG